MSDQKRSFVMYCDFPEKTNRLTDFQFRELVSAICHYTQHGIEPDMTDATALVFSIFKVTLDADLAKWEKIKLERSKAGTKGAEARRQK